MLNLIKLSEIRFEDIENGFNNLAQKRSWKALLKHAKTTKNLSKKDWRSYYCEETLNIISGMKN